MNFDNLCIQLKLIPHEEWTESKLFALQNWCHHNVSTDLKSTGVNEASFKFYMQLAQFYLDDFLPKPSMHLAAIKGFDKFFEKQPQPDINQVNEHGMTALECAVANNNVATTQVLLAIGANPHTKKGQSLLPIHAALWMPLFHEADLKEKKIKIFRLLVAKAPETLKSITNDGDTVLHRMVAQGFHELIEETLKTHPDLLNISNNHCRYPIHTAILNQQRECIKLLMAYPGVEQLVDAKQHTPLALAMQVNPDLAKICTKSGGGMNRATSQGGTP